MKRITLWTITGVLLILAVGGIVWAVKNSSAPQSGELAVPVTAEDHMRGNAESKITLVEYSDFQCPACKAYNPFVNSLATDYGDRIRIVYRHFPLSQHANARPAALAAEAAGEQGKFWEMTDVLFQNQESWAAMRDPEEAFISYAVSLGLDREKFQRDLESEDLAKGIEKDFLSGVQSRVRGTPTFFLNGAAIENPRSYDEFKRIIETALSR